MNFKKMTYTGKTVTRLSSYLKKLLVELRFSGILRQQTC